MGYSIAAHRLDEVILSDVTSVIGTVNYMYMYMYM